MKNSIKSAFALISIAITLLSYRVNAAILRVNSVSNMSATYSNLTIAINAASPGDTIYLEGAPTAYSGVNISKKLRIIGSGYFLNENNPYTQAIPLESQINSITFSAGSDGSVLQGITVGTIAIKDSFITVERCHINNINLNSDAAPSYGDTIRNNYITYGISSTTGVNQGLFVYNNIFIGPVPITTTTQSNGYMINNTFLPTNNATFTCSNFSFQNNIMKNPTFGPNLPANVFYHNIATNSNIPSGNGNLLNVNINSLFTTDPTATTDGKLQLSPTSPAKEAGLLGSDIVDCGAFGGPAPYILSGMPNVPSIYELMVPASVPLGTQTLLINISAAAH
jgi:hypothetical protein